MLDLATGLAVLVSAGTYDPVVAPEPLRAPEELPFSRGPTGLQLTAEQWSWETDDHGDLAIDGAEVLARLFIDERGVARVDQLAFESAPLGVRVRPLLGDDFDLAILGGQFDATWLLSDAGPVQAHLYSPVVLTLLGFSNTDFDDDGRLKYTIGAGAGAGTRVSARIVGPVGLLAGAEVLPRTFNRHQRDALNQVRHEVMGSAELGVGWFAPRTSWTLSGWGELTSQWETRDAGGKDGVDRQYAAAGVRLTLLSSLERPETLDPERVEALQRKADEQGGLDVDDL